MKDCNVPRCCIESGIADRRSSRGFLSLSNSDTPPSKRMRNPFGDVDLSKRRLLAIDICILVNSARGEPDSELLPTAPAFF
jgi:hypothetical protein